MKANEAKLVENKKVTLENQGKEKIPYFRSSVLLLFSPIRSLTAEQTNTGGCRER